MSKIAISLCIVAIVLAANAAPKPTLELVKVVGQGIWNTSIGIAKDVNAGIKVVSDLKFNMIEGVTNGTKGLVDGAHKKVDLILDKLSEKKNATFAPLSLFHTNPDCPKKCKENKF